ncbi:hypothetical protein O6P43_005175 [Quillaja saponaria]|uniref:Uncharacterized protein n=1 Tax=Quillaja saponaria TaxID=32244 RepID=A0AAD7Q5F8_QUISA|nr:hypothetical protein O6P43_005175 [Quillaja saponaria]
MAPKSNSFAVLESEAGDDHETTQFPSSMKPSNYQLVASKKHDHKQKISEDIGKGLEKKNASDHAKPEAAATSSMKITRRKNDKLIEVISCRETSLSIIKTKYAEFVRTKEVKKHLSRVGTCVVLAIVFGKSLIGMFLLVSSLF